MLESPMSKGISKKSRKLRRHFLSHNGLDLVDCIQQSGPVDPVGLIIEMSDDIGKQLANVAIKH